ncbi:MAG: glycosyltransferase family 4 protein [Pseudanabaenaceae cyanobacterium]
MGASRMKILYDGAIFAMQARGGISRYFENLISRLPSPWEPVLTTARPHHQPEALHPHLQVYRFARYGFRPGRLAYWLEKYYFRAVEARIDADVFHATYYQLLTRESLAAKRSPTVVTVYDMIYERYPEVPPYRQGIPFKRQAVFDADVVLCISECTKRDLLECYPTLPPTKVEVTYLASEFSPEMGHGPEPIPEGPYFLYVGLRGGYKNFDCLMQAFVRLSQSYGDLQLCVVGAPPHGEELRKIQAAGIGDRLWLAGPVPDEHLAKLYRHAIAFVYPSLYEGFGIPPLEAMICDTPVIASQVSSIPEVVGEAAFYFDPNSVDELYDQMKFVLEHPAERERKVVQGRVQRQKFHWAQTVAQTVAAYQRLV